MKCGHAKLYTLRYKFTNATITLLYATLTITLLYTLTIPLTITLTNYAYYNITIRWDITLRIMLFDALPMQ